MASSECCSNPPTLNPSSGTGHVESLGGLDSYVTGSPDSNFAVLLISDVYGFEAPNLRKLADKVAAAGFFVVVPDFLNKDPYAPEDANRPVSVWIKDHGPDKGFEDAKPVLEALKSKGVSAIGAAGFCWGGQQIHCLVLKAGLDSNNFIRNSLINTHAKCGFIADAELLRLESARQVFEKMPKKGCVSYTTMIMGLAQDERWTEAVEVFRDMRSAGVIPNEVTMATVISTYSHLGGVWNCRMLHTLVIRLQLEGFVLVSTNLLHIYWGC
ncbi:beta-D-glucanase-like [Pyrus ussuriensis x Pyrus communis]|uniref:Beta-D-glucanase-like n=1 Tax=Pyrus ussuriensis x Pyrus communis TaxID=2448454 RepID=A0A5N5HFD1_9ROSA|nr:beta-D-glucanase-like [Pyrus ussuriensis x Pyrus communis]